MLYSKKLTVIVSLLTVIFISLLQRTASAQSNKYFCGATREGTLATMIRTSYGDVPLILWTSGLFLEGQSPQQRCATAANGFQRAHDRSAQTLRADYLNGQPVICAVQRLGEGCSDRNITFKLNPGTNPEIALLERLRLRWIASHRPLNQGSNRLSYAHNGIYYSDIKSLEEMLLCIEYPDSSECLSER